MRKLRKLIKTPGVFIRDYLNKKYPLIRNEIACPEEEESILINHDLKMENNVIVDFPVDVVFTWVDDADQKWQKKLLHYRHINIEHHGQYATDNARFSNHNELYYSIKSVHQNLPWVRNIFVITDQQRPSWSCELDNINFIDHHEIIDHRFLPTFNSHVIEAHLHLIPGLAENFIYFNDDVFVARPLPVGHFFKSNGIASLFLSAKNLQAMASRGINTPTLSASLQSAALLKERYCINADIPLVHTYVPLKKSAFEQVWNQFSGEIEAFLSHRFRTNHDLNLATFFVPWVSYACGKSVPARDICHYFNIRSPVANTHYQALRRTKKTGSPPHSFCANDFNTETKAIDNYHALLISTLSYYFDTENKE